MNNCSLSYLSKKKKIDSYHLCCQKGGISGSFLCSFRKHSKIVWTFYFQRTAGRLIFWFRIFFLTSLICTVQLHSQSSSSLGRHGFPCKTERFSSSTVPTSQLSVSMAQGVKFATRLSKLNHLLWQEFSISLKGFSPDACRGTFIKTL